MKKYAYTLTVGAIALGAFAGLGIKAWQFIEDASKSVSSIHFQAEQPTAPPETGLLSPEMPTVVGTFNTSEPAFDAASTGADVVINSGDFAYQNGKPVIRLHLLNQGRFTASSVAINLALYADNAVMATTVGVPIALEKPLLAHDDVVVLVPITDEAWQNPAIAQAKQRKVMAQIVLVGDVVGDGVDYPQTSESVWLSQTANDWGNAPNPSVSPLIETASDAMLDNHAYVETVTTPEPLADAQPLDDDEELMGEPRVLSVETGSYRK